jgi:hypothetical protein
VRQAATAAGVLLVALLQASTVSLFPIGGVVVDVLLVVIVWIAVFRGPVTALWVIPLAAITYGFAGGKSPALVLVAYLPLMPLANYLETAGAPLNRYAQTALATAATAGWSRGIFTLAAVVQGAELDPVYLFFRLILPGILFDVTLLSVAYLAFRLLGWEPRTTSLQRGGFFN